MLTKPFVLAALLLSVPATSQARIADVSCDDRSRLTETLSGTMGAERRGAGLRDPETMLEVWVTPHSGDWLIVQHYAGGTSCIVAMGEHWEAAQTGPA